MKKGIRVHDVAEMGLENICKKCISQDIAYLQLVLERSFDGFSYGKFSQGYANSIKEQLFDRKIAILGSYINPSNPIDEELEKDIDKFKEKIKYAGILKPIAVGTETGIYKEGQTDTEQAYQRVLSTLKVLTKEAERYGVNIGIEGVHCFVINTPKKMKRLVDDLNSDNVKVIFDPVNYINIINYQNQDEIIKETFNLLWDKMCVIHAKDFDIKNGEVVFRKPTEGLLDYKLIFEKMKEYKLDIPVICEEISDSDAVIAFRNLDKIRRDL